MPETNASKIAYYKVNKLLWRWRECSGDEGCSIVRGVSLSMDKAPPPLPAAPKPVASPKPPPKRLTHADRVDNTLDGLLSLAEGISRFRNWLDAPAPPKKPKPAPVAKQQPQQTVPPFDIQEIPGAMRSLWMPISAKLMERWFAGRLNYSPTSDDETKGLNQDGKPYAPEMYDMATVKLDWALKYARAKSQYEALQRHERLTTPNAVDAIGKVLWPLRTPYGKIDAWEMSNRNLKTLHENFQFQRAGVERSFSQKLHQIISQQLSNSGIPDDLSGSLGSFNFYVAIGDATFNRDADRATITSVILYIKDNYTFTDKTDEPSQYLGHWNRRSVILVPATIAANAAKIHWLDYPVAVGDMRVRGNVYYPVRNSSFREWQQLHQRGGDFIVYSDHRFVKLPQPIEIKFL